MGIISLASGNSCWRGLDYYKHKKIIKLNKINEGEYESIVKGTNNYNVHLDIEHPRKSTCIMCSTEVLKVKEEKNLKIVNIMSSAALIGNKQEAVYCATKWGEKGYTESLKVAYKGTSVKVIGVYPGGINTNFYKNSRDYVSEEKQASFMNPKDVAEIILSNVMSDKNLTVADLIIERNS